MRGINWRAIRDSVREYFFLQRRWQVVASWTGPQRRCVYQNHDAAERRLASARLLFRSGRHADALLLFREAALFLVQAHVASNPGADADRDLTALAALTPAEVDRLDRREAKVRCEEADRLARAWAASVEPLSARQIVRERNLRITLAVLFALGIPLARQAWLSLPTNVSFHKKVVVSSLEPGKKPAGVVDDSLYGAPAYRSTLEPSPWLVVDLGRRYVISDAQVFGRHDCCFDESVPVAFEISTDGETYRTVATKTDPFVSLVPWVVKPIALRARYVRVRLLKSGYLSLTEVIVYGSR